MDRWSRVRLHNSSLHGGLRRRARNPWAAVPMFGFSVGVGDPGAVVVIVNMPPRTRRQVRELVERQEFESDGSVVAEHFEQPGDPLPQGDPLRQGEPQQQQQQQPQQQQQWFPPQPPLAVMEQWWR
ncbi:hypothetical protein Taro_014399, partial [Colocasia esculenta]|nr:hypothetical protein [Colocasia esculenta]